MGKPTPGPWAIRTLENFGFNVVHYVGGDKFDILRVAKTGEEANARLIAAAPDLLEELEQQADGCSTIISLLSGQKSAVAASLVGMLRFQEANARAAIAKARGQETTP